MIAQIPRYHNVTHELVASPDARRVYIHWTEWSASDSKTADETEVPLVIVCGVNEDHLIDKVDIYWMTPEIALDCTKADEIAAH